MQQPTTSLQARDLPLRDLVARIKRPAEGEISAPVVRADANGIHVGTDEPTSPPSVFT